MKLLVLTTLFLFYLSDVSSQNESDYSILVSEVGKLYEKENVKLYYQLQNDIYESELMLLKIDGDNSKSEILKYFKINYKELKILYHKTNKIMISRFYVTNASENWNEKDIAIMSMPLFSKDGNSAIIFGRYSCGLMCGQTTLFYFTKREAKWLLTELKVLEY